MNNTTELATTTDAPSIDIVPAAADSLAYVLSNWGRDVERKLEATPQPGFLKLFAPLQAQIIKRSTVLTALDKGRIVGFAIYEPGLLHWIYVRRDEYRGKGIGSKLLEATKLVAPTVTFWTSDLRHLGLAEAPYTPFWLRS